MDIVNGDTTITTITYMRNYMDTLLLSEKKVTRIRGELWASEQTEIQTNKYDQNGNKTEYSIKSGTEYRSTGSTILNYYNDKHKVVKSLNFGNCLDAPENIFNYAYYPDGITLKEEMQDTPNTRRHVLRYNQSGDVIEDLYFYSYQGSIQTVYQYTGW